MTTTTTILTLGALVVGAVVPMLQVPAVVFCLASLVRGMELPRKGKA